MDEKKDRSLAKIIIFTVLYFFLFTPISLIGYQLTPYIIKNQKVDLIHLVQNTLQHPIQAIRDIPNHSYWYVFLILELMGFFILFIYLNQKKVTGYQIVGRTMPIHGSASWGIDSELRSPKNVHFRKSKKQLKKDLEKSMK